MDGLILLLLTKFILVFSDCWSEKTCCDWSGGSRGGRYLDICWHLNAPSYVGVTGAGPGTICDNCDDNDILVCNVCVHTVSRVKTLNTRWWGSRGHEGQLPRGHIITRSIVIPHTASIIDNSTNSPSLARSWYKLNVIPSQGSVINYPPCLVLCCPHIETESTLVLF